MIVSRDEFLLLMQKWKNSSAQLRLLFIFGGKTSERPLSSALVVKLSARIAGIDADASFLTCTIGDDGIISVGFEGAFFDFGTTSDSTVAGLGEAEEREIDEAVTAGLTCGINVVLMSFG